MASIFSRPIDLIFLLFFASHILFTVLFEPQMFIPREYIPQVSKDLLDYYIKTYQDPLFLVRPIWFRTFVFLELLFQLPFFFAACYAIVKERNWIRVPGLLYGAHVCTTVAPILAEYYFSYPPLITGPLEQRTSLIAMNVPYFVIPMLWAFKMMKEKPFGPELKVKKN